MAKLRVDKIAAPIVKDEFTGSVQFDGTGDYLSMSDSSDFAFGTGDFTVECFIYPTGNASYRAIVDCRDATTQATGWILGVDANDNIYIYNDGFLLQSGSGATPEFKWYHVAYVRNNGTHTLYVDGVSVASSTSSYNYTVDNCVIGAAYTKSGEYWNGYISNVRLCKGHAVYTENFAPPTRELEVHLGAKGVVFPAADNRTVLLACQSSTDATAEATGRHTLTANGNATAADANPGLFRRTLNLTTVTENTGSVYFDGTSDGLRSNPYDELIIGTGAFTVECWFWRQNITDSWGSLVSDNLYSGAGGWDLYTQYNDIRFYVGGVGEVFTVSDCYSAQTWTHVAAQRDSTGNMSCYINGVEKGVTATNSTDYTDNRILIGGNNSPAGSYPNYVFNGYISNVRVCRGHNVYTSNFAPPTRELEVHPGPEDDRTILLACYDGENVFAEKTGKIIAATGDRLSSPTPTATDSPIGITTHNPGLTRNVDPTAGPTFQGGAGFTSQNWLTLPKGTTTERFVEVANNAVSASSARGIFQGGQVPGNTNTIEYITIGSLGDGTEFGDMTIARQYRTSVSSSTRGVTAGGDPTTNIIDYITISTLGNAKDFGDLFTGRYGTGGCSSSVRGVWAGGFPGTVNTMDYVTIASTGDAKDFGDLTAERGYVTGCGSPSRGVFAGGATPSRLNIIDFITIASMGNAFDFGDLTSTRGALAGCSNSIRGLFAGGSTPTMVNTIDFVSIQTTGNAVDFGDQSIIREGKAACSSSTRGVWGGGSDPSNTKRNTIDFVEFATLGNAIDIGDLTVSRKGLAGCSNGHGGLG